MGWWIFLFIIALVIYSLLPTVVRKVLNIILLIYLIHIIINGIKYFHEMYTFKTRMKIIAYFIFVNLLALAPYVIFGYLITR